MRRIIEFFAKNHLISNLFVLSVLVAGIISWFDMRKEEYPDFAFDIVSISAAFPGAAPSEVEKAITLPLEQELSDLENIQRIESTSKRGSSTIRIELARGIGNVEMAVSEIRNRVLAVQLPNEVEDLPKVRHRKTSQKAIIDVAFFFKDKSLIDNADRFELQKQMRIFETRLLRRPEISQSDRDAYLKEEIHIVPRINDLFRFRMTIQEMRNSIISQHTNIPLGVMQTFSREQVRLDGRLESVSVLNDIPLRSSLLGDTIRLRDVAEAKNDFEDTTTLVRVNGHEAVIFNVVKSSNVGILKAVDIVRA